MADPRALLQKAEKTAASAGSGFGFFGGREQKYFDAADLYTQAANAFRLQKSNKEAGKAFELAAAIQKNNLKEPDDAANTMNEAFKVYRKESPEDAARCLDEAIQHYCARGNFRRAAKQKEDLGEIYELELGDPKRALESYENAASWYEGDNAQSLANKNWLKVADLAALEGDYYKAIEQFEKVAQQSISSNLMRYSVKDYFLKAGLCHLATGDLISAQRALEKVREQDPSFAMQRENQLLVDLVEAIEAGDADKFAEKLFQYDHISKLDRWKTTILLQIKSKIEEADNEFA
ncbi:vesicular-fusion protein sec17 [Grosmannia clavigera kw1407]|uniref:Vesicular-fusion protein sec17 n=1 Tax=Grosmannia clavigera (strain kw1407 / UAMH 11150) TaxID=655863 RepID=F0X7Y5_GROCL|nr:vesicular-fusion protein sec17 [Grosmannia clavigera kw1407]EFX06269.1 vesicular-fusion protein sec17 [Grosmannia clavigera kw1407]